MNEITIQQAFQFCPACGQKAATPNAKLNENTPFRCEHCNFVRFFGPFAAVGGLVVNDNGQLLMVRRAKDPGKGKLGLPGGFIDAGEAVEEALAREIREETSLELDSCSYLTSNPNWYCHRGIKAPVIDLFFLCRAVDPEQIVLEKSELAEFLWVVPNQDHLEEMAFESNRLAVEEWLKLTR